MTTGIAEVNGASLYYEIAGQGHPLVLLSAGSMDHRMWDDQFTTFAEHFTVIRYDVRGAGQSPAPTESFYFYEDLAALLHRLAIEKTFLVGVSLGGRTAIDFSIAYPQLVDGLVLAGAGLSGYDFSPQYIDKLVAVFAALKEGTLAQQDVTFFRDTYLAIAPDHPLARQKIVEIQVDNAHAGDRQDLMHELNPPAIGRLREIQAPTLVVVGGQDCTDIHAIADLLAAQIPGAQKQLIPDAGHILNMEQPVLFNEVVLNFLISLADQATAAQSH